MQTFRPAQAIWDHLSRNGNTVGVVNFPIRSGYPINGFVIPGMLGERPPTYPADLRDSVETSMGRAWVPELPPYRESDRTKWMDLAGRSVEQSGEAAEILIERFRPDFLFVLFRETDRVEHQLWSELSRPIREWAPDLLPFWKAVDAACQRIDRAFRAAGGPALTFVDLGPRVRTGARRLLHEPLAAREQLPQVPQRRRLVPTTVVRPERPRDGSPRDRTLDAFDDGRPHPRPPER